MASNWKLSLLVILSGLGAGDGAEQLLSSQAVMAQTNAVPVEISSSEENPDTDASPILSVRDRLDETSNTLDDGSYYDTYA